jgi:quinol monooxygenase YgiN
MAIKVIVELQAKPGKWAELKSLLESICAKFVSSQPGFLGSTYYEVLDNPNTLVDITDWASPEERQRVCSRLCPAAPMHLSGSC